VRQDELDRHLLLELQVPRSDDDPHAPEPEDLLDEVFPVEDVPLADGGGIVIEGGALAHLGRALVGRKRPR
jgi:hypothetical protein